MTELWEILKGLAGNGSIDKSTFKTIRTLLGSFALYVTIAVAAAIIIYAIIIRNRDEEYLQKSRRVIIGVVIGYSVGVIAILGFLEIAYQIWSGDINDNYWMFAGLIALVVIGLVVTVILNKKQLKAYKWCALAFAVAFVIYAVVLACVVPAIEDDYTPLSNWEMYLTSAILVVVIVALAVLGGKQTAYNAKALTYGAICIALSYALSYVKFFSLPQGGSVTFASLLPLALYSYMFGTRKGLVAGVVYGMLQFIQTPYFYQPMQVLLDYPIAFGAIGLAGIARKFKFLKGNMIAEFTVGTTIAVLLRYVAHVLSGYFVFYSWNYDPDNLSSLAYSLIYNAFTLADLAIVLAVGVLALLSKTMRRTIMQAQSVDLQANENTLSN